MRHSWYTSVNTAATPLQLLEKEKVPLLDDYQKTRHQTRRDLGASVEGHRVHMHGSKTRLGDHAFPSISLSTLQI